MIPVVVIASTDAEYFAWCAHNGKTMEEALQVTTVEDLARIPADGIACVIRTRQWRQASCATSVELIVFEETVRKRRLSE